MKRFALMTAAALLASCLNVTAEDDDLSKKILETSKETSKTIELDNPGSPTDLNFRVTVTVEQKDHSSKKAFDSVFNSRGEIVSIETNPAMANIFEQNKMTKGINATASDASSCGRECRHLLSEGDAAGYAICFYACWGEF